MNSNLWLQALLFLLGAACLYFGAEGFVRGSSRLAEGLGISHLFIGLTLVAIGTSLPELATGITGAIGGNDSLVVGNIVGANIANVSLNIGISSQIHPIQIKISALWRDVLFMGGVSLLFYFLVLDRQLGRPEGVLFIAILGLYMWRRYGRRKEAETESSTQIPWPTGPRQKTTRLIVLNSLLTAAGLAVLLVGARLFVNSALALAQALGVSQGIIGLSLVSIGTTLPEMSTSIVGMLHREYSLVLGNIIGSNIFNLLGILGFVSLIHPLAVEASWLVVEIPVMVAFSLILLPLIFRKGGQIVWWEGVPLLIGYVAFVFWIYQ